MINPQNIHPDYDKNLKKVMAQGYRGLSADELKALPYHLSRMGGPTILMNAKGDLKSVSHITGMIADETRDPPKPRICKGLGPKPKR